MVVILCQMVFLHLLKYRTVFILSLVDVMYHVDWVVSIKPPPHPGNKSHLIMANDFFLMYCWIWFASILLRIFASMFIRHIGLLSFFALSLSGFGIRVMLASLNEF